MNVIDRTFAAAYIDNGIKPRILGRRLRPFSLWHLFLLQVINSPFVRQDAEITLFDLKTAIGACSLRYRQSNIRRPWWPLVCSTKSLKAYCESFLLYVGDYLSKPEYSIIPFDIGSDKTPTPHLTPPPAVVLTAHQAALGAHCSVQQVWDMPIGEVYVAEAIYFHIQGNQVNFMDEDERKFQSDMKAAGMKPNGSNR